MKIKEKINILKTTEKYLSKVDSIDEIHKNWKNMGFFNPWYVIEENGNIIKFTWNETYPKEICIIVKWDDKYNDCYLYYEGYSKLLDKNISKKIELNKETILELEKYLNKNNFYKYTVSKKERNKYITFDGPDCTLEVKINNKYNEEDIVAGAKNNDIIINFGYILFKLSNEENKLYV
jgi:hypothetical protein